MANAAHLAASRGAELDRLPALRARIDELDLGILRLIDERGRTVQDILALKQSAGMPVLDEARERQVLDRLRRMHRGPHAWSGVERIFRMLLEISRGLAR
jgi:3-deoxy-7-phosphoheptulonate synthase / chorismate mutase